MFKIGFRSRIFSIFASIIVAVSTLLMTGGGVAHAANEANELFLWNDPLWCITPLSNNVGSEVVLGECSPTANSQNFALIITGGNTFEIQNLQSDLCITYAYPNGHPDGGYMTQGYCVGAQNQTWEYTNAGYDNGFMYFLPDRRDNNGNNITLDDAGGALKVNNHIDGSYYCTSCSSESWNDIAEE